MNKPTVAFQGEAGAYSELAVLEYFSQDITSIPCHAFEDVFVAVSQDDQRRGLIPIENSLAGSIHRNYDLMLHYDLHIVGEHYLRVSHCLLGLPGAKIEDIRCVRSHPQALSQCEANLKRLGVEMVAEADTAGSARMVRERNEPHTAALASRRAAEVNNLQILAENMEDNPANFTRFLILEKQPNQVADPQSGDYKTSLVFSLKNHPGSLFKALSVFALRDIDLTKIESRPIQGKPWEYLFYIDFAGHVSQMACGRALEHLQELAPFIRILGSYPRHRLETTGE
jgi:prephenate dehydratase